MVRRGLLPVRLLRLRVLLLRVLPVHLSVLPAHPAHASPAEPAVAVPARRLLPAVPSVRRVCPRALVAPAVYRPKPPPSHGRKLHVHRPLLREPGGVQDVLAVDEVNRAFRARDVVELHEPAAFV